MQRRHALRLTLAPLPTLLTATWWLAAPTAHASLFSEADASAALKTALERGAQAAVGLLGKTDGYLQNPKVAIALPRNAEKAATALRAVGQGQKVDDLVTAMNRAAEAAAPKALDLLLQAARQMSVEDAVQIVKGDDTAVTRYFAGKTREPLTTAFKPIVTQATQDVSLARKYNAVVGKVSSFSMFQDKDFSIESYVTGKALDGLYLVIGEEEKKIRQDPVATGSALLKKVFGL
ncbi:DUF4197 domain-containing protein [Ideonella livida]|uniref:DUF4197 domain-containing protein n=1 Tax=Ideonella livida TaxID=2707176 RepID=A0A7C9PIT9_9BURK|nr:DUF4197 domain-containing protein [Ideonella livida]NDY92232.1 DUF4197 domain-containing protein [Ideonella livida]